MREIGILSRMKEDETGQKKGGAMQKSEQCEQMCKREREKEREKYRIESKSKKDGVNVARERKIKKSIKERRKENRETKI